jgi:glycosyltransferase involved in cell wall biosynthesis
MIWIVQDGKMKEKTKILMLLTNPFTLDQRVLSEARSLVKNGYDVTVLGWDKRGENPPFEEKDGINVVRSYNTKFMKMLPYDIFRLHFWWNKGYKDALKLHRKKHFDIIHCHDFDSLPIGVKLKKKLDLPLIYDAHEFWAYMVAQDLSETWANYYLNMEKKLIKYADKIITVNEPLKKHLNKMTNTPVTIVMNCKPLQSKKYEPTKNNKFTLLYIGTLLKWRFTLELIDVAEELPDIHCIIGGKGKPAFFETVKNKCQKVQNVEFIGKVPRENVLPMTKKADLIICMTSPINLNAKNALANKQFEAMVCARPIICTKGTYPGIFTEQHNCGLTAEYNKQSLKATIIKLRDDPKLCKELSKNGLNAAIKEYNWKNQEKKLLSLYEEIISR